MRGVTGVLAIALLGPAAQAGGGCNGGGGGSDAGREAEAEADDGSATDGEAGTEDGGDLPEEADGPTDVPVPPPDRPNIILVITDDQRADTLPCMPEVQRLLVAGGMTFRNNFATTPLCCPARSSVLTGLYAHNHGVIRNGGTADDDEEPWEPRGGMWRFRDNGNEELVVAKRLREEAGYTTGFFGKYLNGYEVAEGADVPPYWDEWHACYQFPYFNFTLIEKSEGGPAERNCYLSNIDYEPSACPSEMWYGGERVPAHYAHFFGGSDQENYITDVLAGKAAEFIARAADEGRPFFVYFAPLAPHTPADSPSRHQRIYDEAYEGCAPDEMFTAEALARLADCPFLEWPDRPPSYGEPDYSDKPAWVQRRAVAAAGMPPSYICGLDRKRMKQVVSLLAVDDAVARFLRILEEKGIDDETVVFLTSDNGYAWGEHYWTAKNCSYEECLRIPLVACLSGTVDAGSVAEALTLNVDLAPTFAELAGLPPDDGVDGRSMVPLLLGADVPWREAVLGECWGGTGGAEAAGTQAAVRTRTWKYVEYYVDDAMRELLPIDGGGWEKELYDLEHDPFELDNLYRLVALPGESYGAYTPEDVNRRIADLAELLERLKAE